MAKRKSTADAFADWLPDAGWKRKFRQRLLKWFDSHARDLPWRETRDPYKIWVSEIMLQQTQVATVRSYFARFIARFPAVMTLAEASESDVLRLWEGLGYYRRARQMHKAAQVVVADHNGKFPDTFDELLALPGIGRYTAGAILSIAHDQRQPIVEANTIRLYSRLMAYPEDPRNSTGQNLLWEFADTILPRSRAGDFNQATMELGAEICTPNQPGCLLCPVASLCPTRLQGLQEQIPVAAKRVKYTDVKEIAVVVRRRNQILLRRCGEDERWAGLWDFPRFASSETGKSHSSINPTVKQLTGVTVEPGQKLTTIKHGVTRFRITLDCYEAEYQAGRLRRNADCVWTTASKLKEYPLSVTGRKIAKLLTRHPIQ